MARIRKGDEVLVLTGRDKGKKGVVAKRVGKTHLIVEGINRAKKHVKPNPMKGQTGGIVDKDLPIHVSNVGLLNPQTQKADKVGYKSLDEGRKARVFKSNGEMVDA